MINPRLARSQIMGGILFGFGMALMEGTVPDETTGSLIKSMSNSGVSACTATIPISPMPRAADRAPVFQSR
jgi:hypothetical protein